jgi:hypothetical protein
LPDIVPERTVAGPQTSAEDATPRRAVEVSPDRDERRTAKRRLPLAASFAGLALLAAAVVGIGWAMQSGVFRTSAPSGTVPAIAEGEDVSPGDGATAPLKPGEADRSRTWITVFSPSDPALVNAPSDARAEVMEDATGSFLRVRSGNSGSAVSFDVGQGILETLAGKRAVFDIVARAEDGKQTQISVDCNFGDLGDCGRRRYAVGHQSNEYLFDVQFPDKRPGAAGTIAINSDFDQQGKSVDIYAIRVSVAE